jgi:hypothetical protein
MKKRIVLLYFAVVTSLLLIHACATTSLKSVWVDESYKGSGLKNILVFGVMQPRELQVIVEDDLSEQFRKRGVRTAVSHLIFPEDKVLDKQEIETKVKELAADVVIVIRLIDIDDLNLYMTYPPYQGTDLYGFYSFCCQNIISSGYNVKFETTIFGAKNGKVIWSALTETQMERRRETIVESYVDTVVKKLHENNYIQ